MSFGVATPAKAVIPATAGVDPRKVLRSREGIDRISLLGAAKRCLFQHHELSITEILYRVIRAWDIVDNDEVMLFPVLTESQGTEKCLMSKDVST